MRVCYLDIETDSLDANVIHCVVTFDSDVGIRVWTQADGLQEYLDQFQEVVAHNGLSFDFPVLAKLWGVRLKFDQMVDTLVLSMMENPSREGGHSLDAWGKRLGKHKAEFSGDFSAYTREMRDYCIQDVKVCMHLHWTLWAEMEDEFSEQSIRDEHRMRIVADRVSGNGFGLNKHKAVELYNRLMLEQDRIAAECVSMFPPIVQERYSGEDG